MEKLKPIATDDDGIPPLLRRGPTVVATTTKPVVTETSNPFDPEKLRISLDFADGIGVKKAILTIPVRRPGQQDFIRVRPDEAFRLPAALIEIKDDRETFLVAPEIARDIPGEYFTATMFTCMNRRRVVPVASAASEYRRPSTGVASVGGRSGRDGDDALGARQGQHESRRLRCV